MGYFDKLGAAGQGENPPVLTPPTPRGANQSLDKTAAPTSATPASDLAADHSTAAVPTAADLDAEPAAKQQLTEEEVSKPTVVLLDSQEPKDDDTAARQAHEASESKRKADWDAKQREKASAEQAHLSRLAAMSDEDAIAASTQRVGTDTERLTRRNMKDCVAAHIQELCRQDAVFARKTLHPRKSMMHCFQYINRMAKKFVQDEMKANGIQPESGVYGDDVPDDLVYQWAMDYFNNPDVQEDKEKDEKFIPRPYMGKSSKTSKAAHKAKKEPAPKPKPQLNANLDGQFDLLGVAG